MQRLERTIRMSALQAPSLPNVYQSFVDRQLAFRRGEVTLIAGQPGAGKSTLALALAVRAKVPTLYISADTHAHTMSLRLLAMLTNTDQSTIEPLMSDNPEWAEEILQLGGHIRWCFDSAPSVSAIEDEIAAHVELMGEPPELVVIDNLSDCVSSDGDEWGGYRALLRDFKWLSREHGTSFIVLHHTSEGVQGNPCPPRHSIQGKVAQTPAVILTVSNDQPGSLAVCPVKNRYGPSSPSGSDVVWLSYNPAAMQVQDVGGR